MRLVYLADAPYVHTRRWVEHFVAAGWETHVISFRPAEIEGAQIHYIEGLERAGKLRYLLHAGRVRRLVSDLQPDILHAMHLTSYGFLAALCNSQPRLVSVWGTDVLEAPGWSPFHHAVTRYALSRADHVTATGLRLANATLPYTPRSRPVTVIPYGVDTARFQPDRNGARATGEVVIGSVGRLSMEKGLDDLLRAAAQLLQRGSPIRIVLAGAGPERASLLKLAGELGIASHINFRGEVPHECVPAILNELDIFVMPSCAEGFGVAALEAAATELPVVASRVHGIPDVVADGVTGLLVPPRNVVALAQAIERLVHNPDLRAKMGHAGRAFVEQRYRWEDNCAQMESLYRHELTTFTEAKGYGTVATN